MTNPKQLIDWSPRWAPNVKGQYEAKVRDEETGLCDPQHVFVRCETCGVQWQTVCASGNVRRHISRFARLHMHNDFADATVVRRPGTLVGERKAGLASK